MDNPRASRRVQPGVRTCLALAAMLLSACLTSRVGPGVLRQDWNQRPRDPDPMANPAAQYPDNRWSDEHDTRIPGPAEAQPPSGDEDGEAGDEGDSMTVDLAKRTLATGLAVLAGGRSQMPGGLAGWLPILEASGTFEEDTATRKLHEQRRARALRAREAKKQRRVERPTRP